MAACFLGWSGNLFLRRRLNFNPAYLLPVIAAYVPVVQVFLFKLSGKMGAYYGPLVTEILTLSPLIVLSVSSTASSLEDLDISIGRLKGVTDSMPGVLSFVFFRVMEYFSMQKIMEGIGRTFFQTRLGMQIVLTILYSLAAPKNPLLLFALPGVLHTVFFNTHVPLPFLTDSLNSTLHERGWNLLERHESITGYISIIENGEKGFRAMRCDHSLLGGEWLRSTKNHILVPEPIYAIFVQLEAIRLVEVAEPVPDHEAKALVM